MPMRPFPDSLAAGRLRPLTPRRHGLVAVVVMALTMAVVPTSAANPEPAFQCDAPASSIYPGSAEEEELLVALINGHRTDHGMAPVATHAEAMAKARSWSDRMAMEGRISHSVLTEDISEPAVAMGENVGCDMSVGEQHQAFVASPQHNANLLTSYFTHVGVGITRSPSGLMFATEVFMELPEAAPQPSPRADPPSLQEPAPVSPPPSPAGAPPPALPPPELSVAPPPPEAPLLPVPPPPAPVATPEPAVPDLATLAAELKALLFRPGTLPVVAAFILGRMII